MELELVHNELEDPSVNQRKTENPHTLESTDNSEATSLLPRNIHVYRVRYATDEI